MIIETLLVFWMAIWVCWNFFYCLALEENMFLKSMKHATFIVIFIFLCFCLPELDSEGLMVLMLVMFFIEFLFMIAHSIRENGRHLAAMEETARKQYQEYAEYYENNRQLIHDMKNHLLILKTCEANGEYKELRKYLNEIVEVYLEPPSNIQSGNWMLDTVLNQKKAAAEQKEILFQTDLSRLENLPFSNTEICALFGNLLDNAIEACEKIGNPEDRKISLKIEQQGHLVYIEIANSAVAAVNVKDGELKTSKKGKGLHGIGIQSIKRVVKKYDGILSHEIKKYEFRVCISFFL